MYSWGGVQGARACANLSLVCAAASSGAESSWARSRRAQPSRGTLEIEPETGREEHRHLCLRAWEGSHDVIRPCAYLVWALGVPVHCSHGREGLGGCRCERLEAKRGNSEQPRTQSLLCPISPSRDAEGVADCVAAWRGDSLTPHVKALAGFLLWFSHRSGVGRGEDKTSQLNFFLMVWWSVWHVNPHCPCSPAWLQWLLLTNSLPQTGKFCYLAQTCSNTLSSQLHI